MKNFNKIGQLLLKLCHFFIFSSGRLVGLHPDANRQFRGKNHRIFYEVFSLISLTVRGGEKK